MKEVKVTRVRYEEVRVEEEFIMQVPEDETDIEEYIIENQWEVWDVDIIDEEMVDNYVEDLKWHLIH